MTRPTLVYFIKPKGKKGPIKIGCSHTPADRLEALAAWSPWPLEVMGSVPGSFKEEEYLHQCFAASHMHREWFKATPHLCSNVKKIIDAGTIEVVRGEISPQGSIRNRVRRKRTEDEKLRFSYERRVVFAQQRVRKQVAPSPVWSAPSDVRAIIAAWGHGRWWDSKAALWQKHPERRPSQQEFARLDEYLADPAVHSVVSSWDRPRDPICIPIFVGDDEVAA
jgi:hypothetical protein